MAPVLHPESFWHFLGLLVVIATAVIHGRITGRASTFIVLIWHLPGTFLHELTHLIAALATLARPTGFSLIPRGEEVTTVTGQRTTRYTLGSVSCARLGAWNSLPVGLAPLALLALAYLLFCRWNLWFPVPGPNLLLLYFLIFVLLYAALPSTADLAIALNPKGLLLYFALLLGGLKLWQWAGPELAAALRPLLP